MAQSAQAKEVVLEIGNEIGEQVYTFQTQNGTVSELVFDTCSKSATCDTSIINSNSSLDANWGGWHNMSCLDMKQAGNSPSLYPPGSTFNPSYQVAAGETNIVYAFDNAWSAQPNESNIIIFTLQTFALGSPEFNGISYSNNTTSGLSYTNNIKAEGREYTEQGRMLYLTPKPGSLLKTHISFEILEGADNLLVVRGPGGKSIGEYLYNNGYSTFTIDGINTSNAFWSEFSFTISPYVHTANWSYSVTGEVTYNDDKLHLHASYVTTPNEGINFASMVTEEGVFGLRSTGDIFKCLEMPTQGYELKMDITQMTNCAIEVLTWTDISNNPALEFPLQEAGVLQTGTDWVWEKIETTGTHTACVPFHYNTITTEESYNSATAGWAGGWSTSVQVQEDSADETGEPLQKIFYRQQCKFIRVRKLDSTLPCTLTISSFQVFNAGYSFRETVIATYISSEVIVPEYDYHVVDVFDRETLPLALTFNSGDLRDPGKRSTGYSKTFELPASVRNQKFLKTMTADGVERQQGDISWRKARVSSNGIVVFNGYARIETSITGQGGRYSCHILQDPSYWPELLRDKKLCDLTLPQHIKSYATVSDSWTKTVDDIPYVYPAINYGEWSKDSSSYQTHHSIKDFHPATYVKAIVSKIFEDIGYTIKSNFFNEDVFKKLIIPYTSGESYNATQDDALGPQDEYSSHASLAAAVDLPYTPATGVNAYTHRSFYPAIPCQNGCTNYSPGGGETIQNGYTVPFTGTYSIHYQASLKLNLGGICWNTQQSQGRWAAWLHVNGLCPTGGECLGQSFGGGAGFFNIDGNCYATFNESLDGPSNMDGAPSFAVWTEESMNSWHTETFTTEIDLQQGDVVQIGLYGRNSASICGLSGRIKDQDFHIYPVVGQSFVTPYEVSLGSALGCGLSQMDFLKGLTELFNLHWTADNDAKEVYAEPYDDFYGSGDVVDWSHKIDRESWSDKFLISELAKTISYRYKKDSGDNIVEIYNEDMDTELWSVDITNNELYRKQDKTLGTSIFSPTFRVKTDSGGDATFAEEGGQWPVMPCMWKGDSLEWGWFDNTSRPDYSTKFNIRILNWHGLSDQTGPWTIGNDIGEPVTLNSYPYAYTYNYNHSGFGALNDNLAWYGIADGLNPLAAPTGSYQSGLFDKFYGRLYEKISGGAALRTCNMDLTQADIAQFDFRNIIKLEMDGGIDTYWTVNKIVDYTPGKDNLTKVELIEWKYGFHNFIKPKRGKATNYGFVDAGGMAPHGGHGVVTSPNGNIIVKPNGTSYIPDVSIVESTTIPTVNNLTVEILKSHPRLPSNTHQFKERLVSTNQYNGMTNSPALINPIESNVINKNAVAFGTGLHASPNQIVLGSYNKNSSNDTFQVGAGYLNEKTGNYERINAISVNRNGEFCVYGGQVVADFETSDITITGDVYYTDSDGQRKKVYLKEKR